MRAEKGWRTKRARYGGRRFFADDDDIGAPEPWKKGLGDKELKEMRDMARKYAGDPAGDQEFVRNLESTLRERRGELSPAQAEELAVFIAATRQRRTELASRAKRIRSQERVDPEEMIMEDVTVQNAIRKRTSSLIERPVSGNLETAQETIKKSLKTVDPKSRVEEQELDELSKAIAVSHLAKNQRIREDAAERASTLGSRIATAAQQRENNIKLEAERRRIYDELMEAGLQEIGQRRLRTRRRLKRSDLTAEEVFSKDRGVREQAKFIEDQNRRLFGGIKSGDAYIGRGEPDKARVAFKSNKQHVYELRNELGELEQRRVDWEDKKTKIPVEDVVSETVEPKFKKTANLTLGRHKELNIEEGLPSYYGSGLKDPKTPEATLDFRIPGVPSKGIGERVLHAKIQGDDPAFFDYIPTDTTGLGAQLLTGPLRARRERLIRERSQKVRLMREKERGVFPSDYVLNDPVYKAAIRNETIKRYGEHDPDHETHVKQLATAALAAGFYGTHRRMKTGTVPSKINALGGRISPAMANLVDVREGYRPVAQHFATFKQMLKHPTKSPAGIGGLELQRWRYRPEGRFIRPDTARARTLEKRRIDLENVGRTVAFQHKNVYSSNPIKRTLARRKISPREFPQYSNYSTDLQGALHHARERMREAPSGSKEYKEAFSLSQSIKKQRRALEPSEYSGSVAIGPLRGTKIAGSGGPHSVMKDKSNLGKNVAIGGAVVGTAVGAGYLYHRLQERKKAPEDRVSFYNKALPPAFHTPPLPYVRPIERYVIPKNALTEDLKIAGRKPATRYAVGLQSRNVKLRPRDRGYDANLPLVGRLGLRGTKGGSPEILIRDQGRRMHRLPGPESGRYNVNAMGKRLPFYAQVGKRESLDLKTRNPNALSARDRENLVYAYGTPLSRRDKEVWDALKNKDPNQLSDLERKQINRLRASTITTDEARRVTGWYRQDKTDERLLDMFSDPDRVDRVIETKQGKAALAYTRPGETKKMREQAALDRVFGKTLEQVETQERAERASRRSQRDTGRFGFA